MPRFFPGRHIFLGSLSRLNQVLPLERSLNFEVCVAFWYHWVRLLLGLLAASKNHRLPEYSLAQLDTAASGIDMILYLWDNFINFVFSPVLHYQASSREAVERQLVTDMKTLR